MTAKPESARDAAEWTTLAISIGVIVVLAGLILVAYLRQGGDPPEIVVTPVTAEVRQTEGGFALPVDIRNEGDETAQGVLVQVSLTTGMTSETVPVQIDFLAGGETVRATAVFPFDPRQGTIRSTASYRSP